MQYRNRAPVTKNQRSSRRKRQRVSENQALENNRRRRSIGGGQPNELGVVQGQNGEQGNSVDPRQAKEIGRSAH